jgi:hypothetical protein
MCIVLKLGILILAMLWTYILRSQISPTSFVVVWFAILKLYAAGLGFGNPNFYLNYFVMVLNPYPPSSKTSSIEFFFNMYFKNHHIVFNSYYHCYYFWYYTCIVFSIIFVTKICGLFGFIFYHKHIFNSRAILSNYPKFKV